MYSSSLIHPAETQASEQKQDPFFEDIFKFDNNKKWRQLSNLVVKLLSLNNENSCKYKEDLWCFYLKAESFLNNDLRVEQIVGRIEETFNKPLKNLHPEFTCWYVYSRLNVFKTNLNIEIYRSIKSLTYTKYIMEKYKPVTSTEIYFMVESLLYLNDAIDELIQQNGKFRTSNTVKTQKTNKNSKMEIDEEFSVNEISDEELPLFDLYMTKLESLKACVDVLLNEGLHEFGKKTLSICMEYIQLFAFIYEQNNNTFESRYITSKLFPLAKRQ